ncbi:O-antigen ligase family protein [Desulfatiferula olefinivorans]
MNGYIIHSDISFKGKHIIGRSSDLLACLSMLVTVVVFQSNRSELKEKKYLTLLMVATLVLATSALMFIGQRGAMLGLFIGWMVYGVFFNRKFLVLIAGLLCAGFLIAEPNDYVMIRIKSILDENQKGNAIRLDLYNSAVPYLVTRHFFSGTGSKNDGQDYLDFFEKQDPAFQEDNARALKHPGNFHNSYMQMAAEGGILFFISFLAGMIYIHHAMITGLKNTELRLQCMAGLVTSAGAAVIFFFHGEFYRYGGIIYYLTLISSVWGYREGFPCRCGGGSDGR